MNSLARHLFAGLALMVPGFGNSEFSFVKEIFEVSCVECHNADKAKGGLRMDTKEAFFEGGDSADAVDLKDPEKSEILRRVNLSTDDDEFMPPSSKKVERLALTPVEINRIKAWIAVGAPWPEGPPLQQRQRSAPLEDPNEPDQNLESIAVYPSSVSLETQRDYHRLIVIATDKSSVTRDVTQSARLEVSNPEIAHLKGTTLHPLQDGSTEVKVSFRGKELRIPVSVKEAQKDRPVSFQQDVIPVLTAAGCNTGSCHGSARGQDGFMISLFGYDPKGDYYRLTRELSGRRINLAIPEDSLLLTKATGAVPHTGGKLFEVDHPFYGTLLEWIQKGAHYDPEGVALPTKIEIEPKQFLLEGKAKIVPLTVKATYSDGSDRDVTTFYNF
jgi:hypothetical protein